MHFSRRDTTRVKVFAKKLMRHGCVSTDLWCLSCWHVSGIRSVQRLGWHAPEGSGFRADPNPKLCADRLFGSLAEAWRSVTTLPTDVKELTPEFYCDPAFLVNSRGLDFGTCASGAPLLLTQTVDMQGARLAWPAAHVHSSVQLLRPHAPGRRASPGLGHLLVRYAGASRTCMHVTRSILICRTRLATVRTRRLRCTWFR